MMKSKRFGILSRLQAIFRPERRYWYGWLVLRRVLRAAIFLLGQLDLDLGWGEDTERSTPPRVTYPAGYVTRGACQGQYSVILRGKCMEGAASQCPRCRWRTSSVLKSSLVVMISVTCSVLGRVVSQGANACHHIAPAD